MKKQRNIVRFIVLMLTPVVLWSANILPIHSSQLAQAASDASRTNRQPAFRAVANGKIAFSTFVNGRSEIFAINADGSDLKQLTFAGGLTALWSPDGKQIAFTPERLNYDTDQICVMNADGSNQQCLTPSGEVSGSPVWSPDSTQIAFWKRQVSMSGTSSQDIYAMNADGSNQRKLTNSNPNEFAYNPSWSPDGMKIAFDRSVGLTTSYVLVMDADGANQRVILDGILYGRAWSPDGSRLLVNPSALAGVWVVNADGGSLTKVYEPIPPEGAYVSGVEPVWSPDSSKVAISTTYCYHTACLDDLGLAEVIVANADGSQAIRGPEFDPIGFGGLAWAPDGKKITFSRVNAVDAGLFMMHADGSGVTSVPNTGGGFGPSWQPVPLIPSAITNGKIAFTSERDGNPEIYSINADGTDIRRLTFNPGIDDYPAWSPDGLKIAYLSESSFGQRAIKIMNADGSGQRIVTSVVVDLSTQNFCGERFSLDWSPDVSKIVFQEFGHIVIVNVDGTNRQNITNTSVRESEPSWGRTGLIAYASTLRGGDGINGLDIRTTDGGYYADYGYFTCSVSPDLSPDGTKLAYVHSNDYPPPGYITIVPVEPDSFPGLEFFHLLGVMNVRWSPDGNYLVFTSYLPYPTLTIEIVDQFGQGRFTLSQGSNPSWQPLAPSGCPNPIDCKDHFVRQHYRDFLNREPDADGLAFWTNEIASCGADQSCIEAKRVNVSAAFFLSIEFQETGYFVYRANKAAYGNLPGAPVPITLSYFLPDTQALGQGVVVNQPGWESALENNKQGFTSIFVQRSRFVSAFPSSLTPTQFVELLFANAGVTASTTDRDAAIGEFGSASTSADSAARSRALRRVIENTALKQQELNHAFVLMQYFGYLRRNPNDSPEPGLNFDGYSFWLAKLNQFHGDYIAAEMVKAFLVSTEYRQRFGP